MKKIICLSICIILLIIPGCSSSTEQPVSIEENQDVEIVEGTDVVENESLYEQFLHNQVIVHINRDADRGSLLTYIDEDELTLEELTNAIIESYVGNSTDAKISFGGIYYSYIDCGNDGIEELALRIDTPMIHVEEWQEYIIIKEIDGKLETIYSEEAWGRSYVHMNIYGYIYNDGSGGAANHSFWKGYIDGGGVQHQIYSDSTEINAIGGEYANDTFWFGSTSVDVLDEEKDTYQGTYMLIEFYLDENYSNPADYYCLAKVGDFYDHDDGYKDICYCNILEDASSYDVNSPIMRLVKSKGISLTSIEDIYSVIEARELEAGLNQEIKDGKEIPWQYLEIDFTPYISTYNSDNFLKIDSYFPQYFYLSRADKGTATQLTLSSDGSFEGKYSDYTSESDIGIMNEFIGEFTKVKQLTEHSYSLTLSNLKYKYTPDTEGYETLSNGHTVYRKYVTPYGLENSGAVDYILYIPGTPIEELDSEIFDNLNPYHLESLQKAVSLDGYLLFNKDADSYCVWIAY